MTAPLIVGFGGTTRAMSSGEKLVRGVLSASQAKGARTIMFDGPALQSLPHYAPEHPDRTPEQTAFIDAIRQADGIVIGTPAYHGGMSGLVKNAIDLVEDTSRDGRSYFSGRAVGLVVSAAGWQACGVTLQSMRGVVHALRGWPTPLGITVNTIEQQIFDKSGAIKDPNIAKLCALQADEILHFIAQAQQKAA